MERDPLDDASAGAAATAVRAAPLTATQRRAVTHSGGPLAVIGAAGSGKTRTLIERFGWLVERGVRADRILTLTPSATAADALRATLEDSLRGGYEELAVHTPLELGVRLLRSEALEAAVDPFFVPVARADRVAMLLEHIDELTLRRHDFRGQPAALMASFVERIDRLKGELVDAGSFAAWAERLPADDADSAGNADSADPPAGNGSSHQAPHAQRHDRTREREFARVYAEHDRMLAERGTLDSGEVLLTAIGLLHKLPQLRARAGERYEHVLVDEYQDLSLAEVTLVELLAQAAPGQLVVAGDDDGAIERIRGASTKNLLDFARRYPGAERLVLDGSHRFGGRIAKAAEAVVAPTEGRLDKPRSTPASETPAEAGEVAFWQCANERSQAQNVAADLERLLAREDVAPESACVLVRSLGREAQAIAGALEERAIPYRVVGAAAFFERAEVRDVLAWLRLLVDPADASAVVRALSRSPIELRSLDLARVVQIARRRKLDMVTALIAATESPQLPPEARERVLSFLKLHRVATGALDTQRPDVFVHRLVERLGLRRQQLFAAHTDVVERLVNLAKLGEMAAAYVRRAPQSTPREFARYIAAVAEAGLREEEAIADPRPRAVQVMSLRAAKGKQFDHVYVIGLQSSRMPGARPQGSEPIPDELLGEELPPDTHEAHTMAMRRLLYVAMTRARRRLTLAYAAASERGALQPPSPFIEDARAALDARWERREEELFGPAETLHSTLRLMRDEVLDGVARIGGRLGELRLDTDLDISHGVVRYLELMKLAALIDRPSSQTVADALPDLNARLLAAATSLEREIFETSPLDQTLLAAEHDERRRAQAIAARDEPSLEPFLPKRGEGLVLSASDIEAYRTCPLKYKFARVFRIPTEPTLHQRFGILVHQVLERYHASAGSELGQLMGLLDAGWRRGGFGDSEEERQLREKARAALTLYHHRLAQEPAEPVWFERSFSFRLGPHQLRGRVDRVDRLPGEGFELIDYKTGRPKTPSQLKEDIQLSLYAVGAREAWHLDAARQSYYYVLDNEKVPVPRGEDDRDWLKDTVLEVADGILGQGFEPTPSYAACAVCDFRIACPAAEK